MKPSRLKELQELTDELVKLSKSRSGPPKSTCERRFLLMWIFEECQLRWPETTKRDVWEAYKVVCDMEINAEGSDAVFKDLQ
jgi:hypothetical protein